MAYSISKIEFGFLDKEYEKAGIKCEKVHFLQFSSVMGRTFGGRCSLTISRKNISNISACRAHPGLFSRNFEGPFKRICSRAIFDFELAQCDYARKRADHHSQKQVQPTIPALSCDDTYIGRKPKAVATTYLKRSGEFCFSLYFWGDYMQIF